MTELTSEQRLLLEVLRDHGPMTKKELFVLVNVYPERRQEVLERLRETEFWGGYYGEEGATQ